MHPDAPRGHRVLPLGDAGVQGDLWGPEGDHHGPRYCTWHLSQNVVTNCKAVFGFSSHGSGGNAAFHNFKREWWRICKRSDVHSRDAFDQEWAGLIDIMRTTSNCSAEALAKAIQWLGEPGTASPVSLYAIRTQWAHRWTWAIQTYGCSATSRGEGIFSTAKSTVLSGNLLVSHAVKALEDLDDLAGQNSVTSSIIRRAKQLQMWGSTDFPPLLASIKKCVTPYAFDLMAAQYVLSDHYLYVGRGDGDEHIVHHHGNTSGSGDRKSVV